MTWFDSTVLYATTSTSMADRLSHTQEAGGSSPLSSTVAEVEVDDTPGCGPGGSRFESGRSPNALREIWDQRGLIRLTRGFDSRSRDLVHADVAQLEEASRSDRDQCEFESRRQYQLDVAQWRAHRRRKPGVGGSSPPVQTNARW